MCGNTLALPIAETDDAVLATLEGEVLGTRFINELLSLVDDAPDETLWLSSERDRIQTEVTRLVGSIAAGVPADSVAPLIREKEAELRRLDARLRTPQVPRLDVSRLRAALEQRAASWRADLRAEPKIARMLVRQLVAPLTLWDLSDRPDFVKWETTPTTGLLNGLATAGLVQKGSCLMASPEGFGKGYRLKFSGIAA